MPAIPESLTIEHEALHARLVALARTDGTVGDAARAVARALHAHFEKEDRIALPPLALLRPLSRGEMPPEAARAAELARELTAELPAMLAEHARIVEALRELREAGLAAGSLEAQRFADALALHARTEEEVLYPAAVLVGDWIDARLADAVHR